MSDYNQDRVYDLVDEAECLPYGEARLALVKEALKIAETTRDLEAIFHARLAVAYTACFTGRADEAITAFAWCLAKFNEDTERFSWYEHTVLWYFKNVLHSVHDFPQISLNRVEELRDQMATLYRKFGYNARPVHYTRFIFAIRCGDKAQALESLDKFRAEPRDSLADCEACEADGMVEYYDFMGQWEKAVETAQPALNRAVTCAEVPHRTYAYVLRSLSFLGDYEEADRCQRNGYRLIRNNPSFLQQIAMHMAYLLHRNRLQAAWRMLERHLGWAISTHELQAQYYFYLAASRTLARLAERKSTHKLNLPREFDAYDPSGNYDLAGLIDWFENQRLELGERFNARNENDYFTGELVTSFSY